jgi:hypothetical protein
MDASDPLLSVAAGLGLAAACGFRVFVPLLALGWAAHEGHVALAPGFEWLASEEALVALGTATALEIGAYFVPWLDQLLDTLATPSAVAAGVLATAALLTDLPPALRWAVALIGGGGAAGVVQTLTALTRLHSTAFTGGLANPVVALLELGGAVVAAFLALAVPVVALALVTLAGVALYRVSRRLLARRAAEARGGSPG